MTKIFWNHLFFGEDGGKNEENNVTNVFLNKHMTFITITLIDIVPLSSDGAKPGSVFFLWYVTSSLIG